MKNKSKIKVLWLSTPLYPRYGVMNILLGWAENINYDDFEITLACYSQDEKELSESFSKYPEITIIHLPDLANFKEIYLPQIIALNKLFKVNKFDIIHSIFIQADIVGAICKRLYGVPIHVSSIMGQLISSVNGRNSIKKLKIFTYKTLYTNLCSNIDCYLPITQTSLNQLEKDFKLKPKRCQVIYSGVPLKFVQKKVSINEHFLIGVASQLIYEKGIDIIIRALPEIKKTIPTVKLLIAGEGPEKNNLVDLSKTLGVLNLVEFCGFVEEMPKFLSSLNVFVFPARPSYDGLPRVILEAMVQKTPVIASNTPEISEIMFLDGINGIVFNIDDPISLTEKINTFISDPNAQNIYIENAYRMSTSISVRKNVWNIQNTYLDLMNKYV